MTPEFPLIFPLTQNGDDVTVKYPVMINGGTIIKPGMILRVLYVLSIDSQLASTDLALAAKGDANAAYSRAPAGTGNVPTLPPQLAHEIEGYRRTVWQVSDNFVLAMAQYPTDQMHLIYEATGKDNELSDERFNFFDGLFVGLPNGKVTVIAVEKDSKASHAGLKAGDEIISIGGIPTGSLSAFAAAYTSAKKTATENEVTSYPMMVRSAAGGDAHPVNIGMPPSLKGGLMDDFNSPPPPANTPKPATP